MNDKGKSECHISLRYDNLLKSVDALSYKIACMEKALDNRTKMPQRNGLLGARLLGQRRYSNSKLYLRQSLRFARRTSAKEIGWFLSR